MSSYVTLHLTAKQTGLLRAGLASYMTELGSVVAAGPAHPNAELAAELIDDARSLAIFIGAAEVAAGDDQA